MLEKVFIIGHVLEFSPLPISKYVKNKTFIDEDIVEIPELDVIHAAITGKENKPWP